MCVCGVLERNPGFLALSMLSTRVVPKLKSTTYENFACSEPHMEADKDGPGCEVTMWVGLSE